jgi:hypothetical protein
LLCKQSKGKGKCKNASFEKKYDCEKNVTKIKNAKKMVQKLRIVVNFDACRGQCVATFVTLFLIFSTLFMKRYSASKKKRKMCITFRETVLSIKCENKERRRLFVFH